MAKKAELDAAKLRSLAAEIEEKHRGQFLDLASRLKLEEGMKLTKVSGGAGGSKCTMAGITATSTAGDHSAVTNWANAARRKAIELDAEIPAETEGNA